MRVESLGRHHLLGCAAIIDSNDLFARYGYVGQTCREQLRQALDNPRHDVRVAMSDRIQQEPLGFAWLIENGAFDRSAYLRLIAVDPRAQRSGAGRTLMRALEARHLERSGILLLAADTNTAAHRFYESLGYTDIGLLRGYVVAGMDERVYYKAMQPRGAATTCERSEPGAPGAGGKRQ